MDESGIYILLVAIPSSLPTIKYISTAMVEFTFGFTWIYSQQMENIALGIWLFMQIAISWFKSKWVSERNYYITTCITFLFSLLTFLSLSLSLSLLFAYGTGTTSGSGYYVTLTLWKWSKLQLQ